MYDAIVVGARCAGSPTALLLARKGYRVLLVDRPGFPSDTLSTHYIHQPGVARLKRWGLLDTLLATGCPPVAEQVFDVGPFALRGAPPPYEGVAVGYAPRRTVLDKILLDAAHEAGVETREHYAVLDLLWNGERVCGIRGRSSAGLVSEEAARVVIGADGVHSMIARLAEAPSYNSQPTPSCAYYTYFRDAAVSTAELYPRPDRMLIAAPTHDGLTLTIVYWPASMFGEVRSDIEAHFMAAVDLAPALSERLRAGARAEKFRGSVDLGGFFRRPYGPGWALVGDAAYHKNPITAEGITDAFRDAELLSEALDEGFAGRRPPEAALADYERARNEAVMPIYGMTCELAKLEPPPPEMQRLFAALRDNGGEAGRFMGTIAGTVPIPEFFSPENISRLTHQS